MKKMIDVVDKRAKLPDTLYAGKRSITLNVLHNDNKMASNVPSNARVANVPSNVPLNITDTNTQASNVAMVGNIAHVPPGASVANVPSNVKVNIVPMNANTDSTTCPLTSPSGSVNYCRPAPFQSSTGEKYFRMSEAYGSPLAM